MPSRDFDGTGKSTQIDLLRTVLKRKGLDVVVTANNKSPLVSSGPIKDAKREHLIQTLPLVFVRALDLYERNEREVMPALARGAIVLADRWHWTPVVREAARGLDPNWLKELYKFAAKPDKIIYLKLSPAEALARMKEGDRKPKYYESGQDIHPHMDREQSFLTFEKQEQEHYENLVKSSSIPVTVISTESPISQVQTKVQAAIFNLLPS